MGSRCHRGCGSCGQRTSVQVSVACPLCMQGGQQMAQPGSGCGDAGGAHTVSTRHTSVVPSSAVAVHGLSTGCPQGCGPEGNAGRTEIIRSVDWCGART